MRRMKKYLYVASLLALTLSAFLAGYWYSQKKSPVRISTGDRKILYYIDPMNPAYKSDKPGVAPGCGMPLEPVYADKGPSSSASQTVPPGTVAINPAHQQLIGVRVEQVEKASGTHTVRALGRVAADETRIYRINAFTEGWIRKVFPLSTGSMVKKDQPLAYFYGPGFLQAQRTYISAMGSQKSPQASGSDSKARQGSLLSNVQPYRETLQNLGMTDAQIDEIGQTRNATEDVVISSPVTGFIISRNVSPGQRFEKGTELFRIADLSLVWILVDTYESEARYFRPGQTVQVRYQGKVLKARVSHIQPQFDPATRTLKVRLEMENHGFMLRPDMFVNVEHSVEMPSAMTVPVDAVLDSGLTKTIFVERSPGIFEPRKVETGRYFNNRVEIAHGLMPGEKIVVSGNFLMDSESKFKMASQGVSGAASTDPACGMTVDESRANAAGMTSVYRGKTYYFCSTECKLKFDKTPQSFTGKPAKPEDSGHHQQSGGSHHD
jgi:membrane fusion protein, copper/silver efflux system